MENKSVIESKKEHKRARIKLSDGTRLAIFFNYDNGKYLGIRLWKLKWYIPIKLLWSMPRKETIMLHGWFWRDGDLMEVMCKEISKKKNFQELKMYLIQLEKILEENREPMSWLTRLEKNKKNK